MILVYTPVVKPRIKYIFNHFFCFRMQKEVSYTSDLSVFIAHSGPKMSYGDKPLGNEFFVRAHGLLAEQGVNDVGISVFDWDGLPAFFAGNAKSVIPFDFFAASFYLISRYEEYQPYVSDALGRFTSEQSLAHKHNFLHLPLVDLWFERFLNTWNTFFELSQEKPESCESTLVLEIPEIFAYKSKVFLRTFFEVLYDFFSLRFGLIFDRIMVFLKFRKDPLEGLQDWIAQLLAKQTSVQVFVLFSRLGIHDRSLGVFNKRHQEEIKSFSDYAPTAPLASHESSIYPNKLQKDVERFSSLIHRPIESIRQHKLVLRFPDTYRLFATLGIKNDYSMQYSDNEGFRSSTAFPFRFYDLGDEQQTPLNVYTVCLSEAHIRKQRHSRKMRQLFYQYQNRLAELNAPFIVALTNSSFNSRTKNNLFLTTVSKLFVDD